MVMRMRIDVMRHYHLQLQQQEEMPKRVPGWVLVLTIILTMVLTVDDGVDDDIDNGADVTFTGAAEVFADNDTTTP